MANNAPKRFDETTVETTSLQKDSNEYVGIAQNNVSKKILTSNLMTKANVGLGNVDNTSDEDKPISTAVQEALGDKANSDDVANALANKQDKAITIDEQATTVEGAIQGNTTDVATALSRQDVVLDNKVVNGDFSSGVGSFLSLNSTLSVSNSILSITGTGGDSSAYMRDNSLVDIGNEYLYILKTRVTNSECSAIAITRPFSFTIATNPVENKWYYVTVSKEAIYTEKLRIGHIYADASTANGKVMEVDGNYGVYAINKTQLGLTDIPDDIIAYVIEEHGYFEGEMTVSQKEMFIAMCKYMAENRSQIVALGGSF